MWIHNQKRLTLYSTFFSVSVPTIVCAQVFPMCLYELCAMNDLIRPCNSQQRGLGNIRSKLHTRALMVSLCFIYIQQYTGLQPTPKRTYTNHSQHAKLNLNQSGSLHEFVTSGDYRGKKNTYLFVSGLKKGQVTQKT